MNEKQIDHLAQVYLQGPQEARIVVQVLDIIDPSGNLLSDVMDKATQIRADEYER